MVCTRGKIIQKYILPLSKSNCFSIHPSSSALLRCEREPYLAKHLAQAKPDDGKASLVERLELVVVSPLMRALETAAGCLGGGDPRGTDPETPGLRGELSDDWVSDAGDTRVPLMVATDAVEDLRPGHASVDQPMVGAVQLLRPVVTQLETGRFQPSSL